MTTPATSAMGPQTGSAAPPAPTQSTCEELKSETDKGRETLGEKTKDKTLVGKDDTGLGTCVSACQIISPDGTSIKVAHNNQQAQEKCPDVFEKGGEPAVREGNEEALCGYTHPAPPMQKSGHAEARILDGLASKAMPKQLTFSIDWIRAKGPSKMPCSTCHTYLCKVAQDCEVQIYLCDKKNQPHELPCPADASTRQDLEELIDG